MKLDAMDIIDRMNIHIGALDYIEDHAPGQAMSHLLTTLRESMETTRTMLETSLHEKPTVREMIQRASQ